MHLHVTQCSCRGKGSDQRCFGPVNNFRGPTLIYMHAFTIQYSTALLQHVTACPTDLRRYQWLYRRMVSCTALVGGSCISCLGSEQSCASRKGGGWHCWERCLVFISHRHRFGSESLLCRVQNLSQKVTLTCLQHSPMSAIA